jgi:sucrose phosphorylase
MFLDIKKIWPEGYTSKEELGKIFVRRPLPFSDFVLVMERETNIMDNFRERNTSDQIDININSTVQKIFYNVIESFEKNLIRFIRLDAVGYVKKSQVPLLLCKTRNFSIFGLDKEVAEKKGIVILPELHAEFSTQKDLSELGFGFTISSFLI